MTKILSPMQRAAEIQMPLFNGATLSLSEVSFRLRACIVHLEESATCGHYRALLIHEGDEASLRYCDDGCRAKVLRSFDEVAEIVYVLFFVRETPSS